MSKWDLAEAETGDEEGLWTLSSLSIQPRVRDRVPGAPDHSPGAPAAAWPGAKVSAAGSPGGLGGGTGPGAQVRLGTGLLPLKPRSRTWACPRLLVPGKQASPQSLSFTVGWVGEGAMRGVVPLGVQALFLLHLLLQVTLPCLPAPLQPGVCGPVAGDPGLGHRGAPDPVWTVRCRLLPPGACPGDTPTHTVTHPGTRACSRAMFPCASALLAAAAGTRDWPGQFCSVLGDRKSVV